MADETKDPRGAILLATHGMNMTSTETVQMVLRRLDAADPVRKVLPELVEALERNRVRTGDAYWPEEPATIECDTCGYSGHAMTLSCCCYDEHAVYCSPSSPGRGCPSGGLICPVCDDGEGDVDPWEIIREIRVPLTRIREINRKEADDGE